MYTQQHIIKNRTAHWLLCLLFITGLLLHSSCKKLVAIGPPASTITTAQAFADSADADAAVLGIYTTLANNGQALYIGNGALSLYCGLSADELTNFTSLTNQRLIYSNALTSTNTTIEGNFWDQAYKALYQANACIENIQVSAGIPDGAKSSLTGEAKFLRAFINFYLVNLFGNVPLITSTNYKVTALTPGSPAADVYKAIIADLADAQSTLPDDYSLSPNGDRIRANKWAATALLARVYLYTKDYDNAGIQASAIINKTSLYGWTGDLNSVFSPDNPEAILQWNMNNAVFPYNATAEGYVNIPRSRTSFPTYYLSDQLLGAFEPGDLRRSAWVDSTVYSGKTYYYPSKYKNGPSQSKVNGPVSEWYTVLRLPEQYLIRAEAAANGAGGLSEAIDDLNAIRSRAGLPPYAGPADQKDAVLKAIYHERQIEFFMEWGHRWLDLKRTGRIDDVMSAVTPKKIGGQPWNSYQQLYPIPQNELNRNPNLRQNPGY